MAHLGFHATFPNAETDRGHHYILSHIPDSLSIQVQEGISHRIGDGMNDYLHVSP